MPQTKNAPMTLTAHRQKSGYRIVFTWTTGSPRIEVRFAGDEHGFDAPAVYDHEKGEVTIRTGEEFVQAVNEYMENFSHYDLIAHWQNRRVE